MGNNNGIINECKQRKENQKYDEYFINHHRMYNISNNIDVSQLDRRRIVFISIRGLFKSWKQCPSISLYNAIIIVPLKKQWIESPDKYQQHPYYDIVQDNEFVTFLRWKQHQKLIFFLLDNNEKEEEENGDSLIASIWRKLSLRLKELYDPMGDNKNGKYNPLIFDESYWRFKSQININNKNINILTKQYDINVDDVLLELYTVTMRYKTIKQILIESNPTLNVITNYYHQSISNKHEEKEEKEEKEEEERVNINNELDHNWWISSDYNHD